MYVVDAHCDTVELVADGKSRIINSYNFSEKYKQLQLTALFCGWPGEGGEASYRRATRYFQSFDKAMHEDGDKIAQVRSYPEIEKVLSSGRHAALLSMEGGSCARGAEDLREFYGRGVRVFGLVWSTNDLAAGSDISYSEADFGLTGKGRAVIAEGNRLGMIFDVSHISDKGFWEVASLSEKPILATHSNFRSVCDVPRNLNDDMAREIFRRDGMIGLNLYTDFVSTKENEKTVEGVFRHLDYGLSIGGEDHIGFGCDIDGIDTLVPKPLSSARSFHDQLIEYMLMHNYSEELVRKVSGGNFLNFFKKYL